MDENLDPIGAADDLTEPPASTRVTEPYDTSAPVTTTALISAIEPKLPPFRGD